MQVVEKFTTKVKASVVISFLRNYYRSQDYRTIVDDDKVVVVPYSTLSPFSSMNKSASIHSMEYLFAETAGETAITFIYKISFFRKVVGLILPIVIFGMIYLTIKMMIGSAFISGIALFGVFVLCLALYSYLQTKNFVNHIAAKNKKLLQEMEQFALNHVGSGLMTGSFEFTDNPE